MKKFTKGLMMLAVVVMLMAIARGEVFAENETVEYNVDMFENEGCLYSLDNEDNFSENHIWMLEAGSEHNLYVKYPDGRVVKMPFVVPQAKQEESKTGISDMLEYDFDLYKDENCLYSLDNEDNFTENHVWQLEIGTGHTVYVKYPDGKVVNGGTFVVTSSNSKPIANADKSSETTKEAVDNNATDATVDEATEAVTEEVVREESKNSGSMAIIIVIIVIAVLIAGAAVFMKKRK